MTLIKVVLKAKQSEHSMCLFKFHISLPITSTFAPLVFSLANEGTQLPFYRIVKPNFEKTRQDAKGREMHGIWERMSCGIQMGNRLDRENS